ncbi:MAG: hypothetical protein M3514_10355 [Actinomycetota bacterium]|jgi:hypothetical protein|nr:hypothetical protein [Rubrobacteraceae bacterium]MBA3702506.1 hypothetical protein [Rubrobacteraceae bacterium]MDQ3302049.1 hypothetical protein [Actinomycetota bacterium]MDQ3497890.1 hypothetical protein [Actinomycetota bacterium]
MRRVSLVCLTVFLAAGLATFASLFAVSEARPQVRGAQSQYAAEGAAASGTAPPKRASDGTFVSQGTFIGRPASEATLNAVAKDLAEEERLPDYSQVVDNDTSPTVTVVRNDPVNTACRTLIEESRGCEERAALQGA